MKVFSGVDGWPDKYLGRAASTRIYWAVLTRPNLPVLPTPTRSLL